MIRYPYSSFRYRRQDGLTLDFVNNPLPIAVAVFGAQAAAGALGALGRLGKSDYSWPRKMLANF